MINKFTVIYHTISLMRKRLIIVLLTILIALPASATHNRAGEITYRQISDLTFEVTITTFTYILSLADRPRLMVNWGDGSNSFANRLSMTTLPNFYRKNVYTTTHTFPGPGVYRIVVQDPNRNYGVANIPNSVNVVFSVQSTLTINPAIGFNSTPVLLNPPYDKAAKGYTFIHNPAAFDPDGDSLSYKLTVCTKEDGLPIENYTFPPASDTLYVDPVTGDLVWDAPVDVGIYNVAMEIEEWRNGIKIGAVVRDMQIDVFETTNNPPVNEPLNDYCVEAGDTVDFYFISNDPDNDMIAHFSTSGVFEIEACTATFTLLDSIPGRSISRFTWFPCHEAVRQQPYSVIFKSEDNNEEFSLFDLSNMSVKVLGPSPELINASPEGNFIRLSWEPYVSDYIAGYAIYRREGASTFEPDSCTNGIPAGLGFSRVGYAEGASTLEFVDTDNGGGLQYGIEYTYRIVAVYPNGTESKASNEISSSLITGIPFMRNVSVRVTDQINGSIFISWQKPDQLDTIPSATGPYEFLIYRAVGVGGTDYQLIHTLPSVDLNDTVFIDTLINTVAQGYNYKVELYNDTPGNRFLIGDPGIASSMFIQTLPGDRKMRFVISRNVPWINTRYDFFRYNPLTMEYDSVGSTNQLQYTDTGLENGTEYCYYVRSEGGYLPVGLPRNLINLSQISCAVAEDNEPPCVPDLQVYSECDSMYNYVSWSLIDQECYEDVAGYNLFYKPTYQDELSLLEVFNDRDIFSYTHYPGDIVAGCYAISAFDSVGNVSDLSTIICVDSCDFYQIPNVFTPNGDGMNDVLIAQTSALVERVDFKLYNRNGQLIFATDDPKLNWDGTYNGRIVSPGIYFYHCDVFEQRISGLEEFHLSGFVHVITEPGGRVVPPDYKK